jgi:hypothetical protein
MWFTWFATNFMCYPNKLKGPWIMSKKLAVEKAGINNRLLTALTTNYFWKRLGKTANHLGGYSLAILGFFKTINRLYIYTWNNVLFVFKMLNIYKNLEMMSYYGISMILSYYHRNDIVLFFVFIFKKFFKIFSLKSS